MPATSRTPRAHLWRGKARIKLPCGNKRYEYRILGPWGSHLEEERRVVAEWLAHRAAYRPIAAVTVAGLIDRYLQFAKDYYPHRPIGENDKKKYSSQYARVRTALGFPLRLYANDLAEEFDPPKLEACREQMIQTGYCRQYINCLMGCVQRTWEWGCGKKMVTPQCSDWLLKVKPLAKRRSQAPEGPGTPKVIPRDVIDRTLTHASKTIAAMVRTQLECCMRPEEVCIMRKNSFTNVPTEVDGRQVMMWGYYPQVFKGDHLDDVNIQQVIPIPPTVQVILQPFIEACQTENEYLFSPRRSRQEELALLRTSRKTKVQPSQLNRKKNQPRKQPGIHYTPNSYRQAVHRACDRADIHRWNPKQLRHTKATEIRAKYDKPDHSQAALRHKHVSTSEIYAKLQVKKAFEIAAREDKIFLDLIAVSH